MLMDEKKNLLLLHGHAGSGKSVFANQVELAVLTEYAQVPIPTSYF